MTTQPVMATINADEYERLTALAEAASDIAAYDRARAAIDAGADEMIPSVSADRLMNGENAVRVYREMRGMSQATLANAVGVSQPDIAGIEAGRKEPSLQVLRGLVDALGVSADDLI